MLLLDRVVKGGTPMSAQGDNERMVRSRPILTRVKVMGEREANQPSVMQNKKLDGARNIYLN